MDAPSTDDRLKDLEMKVTYQDDVIETLNQVVIELRATVDVMAKRIQELDQANADGTSGALPHERPPHY